MHHPAKIYIALSLGNSALADGIVVGVMRSMFLIREFLLKRDRFGRGASVVCGVKCDRFWEG
jgi:hypothetical protein